MIGWAAASGEIALEPFVLFLIVFLWTPPHFWALSLNRTDEYRAVAPGLFTGILNSEFRSNDRSQPTHPASQRAEK